MALLCCRVNDPQPGMVLEVSHREHSHCPSHHWSLNIQGTGNACPKEIKLEQNWGLIQSGWEHSLDQLEVVVGECGL